MIRWGLAIFIGIAPFLHGMIGRIETYVGFAFMAVLFGLTLIRTSFTWTRLEWAVALLLGWMGYSLSYAPNLQDAITESLKITALIGFIYIIKHISDRDRLSIIKSWIYVNTSVVLIGIAFDLYRENRLQSVIEYANVLAIFLLISASASILLYWRSKKLIYFIHFFIQISGMLLTMTRSVWLLWGILLVAVLILLRDQWTKRDLATLLAGHVAGFFFAGLVRGNLLFFMERAEKITTRASEFQIRLKYWGDAFQMIADHPWFGVGAGGWKHLQQNYQQDYYVTYVHNGYIQYALDYGLIGLAMVLVVAGMVLIPFYMNRYEQSLFHKEWGPWLKIVIPLVAIHIGFDFDLSFTMFAVAFGILLGLTKPSNEMTK